MRTPAKPSTGGSAASRTGGRNVTLTRSVAPAGKVDDAVRALDGVDAKWGKQYPQMIRSWRERFAEWSPFLAFPLELRRAVYTTNTIEALNRILRKTLKTRGPLPTDEAALKLLFLAIRNAKKTWGVGHREWKSTRRQLALLFDGRLPLT